jgi:hypothetical protein
VAIDAIRTFVHCDFDHATRHCNHDPRRCRPGERVFAGVSRSFRTTDFGDLRQTGACSGQSGHYARQGAPRGNPERVLSSTQPATQRSGGRSSEELEGIARFKLHEAKVEEFKRLAAQCMEIVRSKDTGTLQYDVTSTTTSPNASSTSGTGTQRRSSSTLRAKLETARSVSSRPSSRCSHRSPAWAWLVRAAQMRFIGGFVAARSACDCASVLFAPALPTFRAWCDRWTTDARRRTRRRSVSSLRRPLRADAIPARHAASTNRAHLIEVDGVHRVNVPGAHATGWIRTIDHEL